MNNTRSGGRFLRRLCCAAVAVLTLSAAAAVAAAPTVPTGARERYPYGSAPFSRFVADSYRYAGAGDPRAFFRWMDAALARRAPGDTWSARLAARRRALQGIGDPVRRARAEKAWCASLHKTIKTTIPRFSLDRGFEFANAARRGERQCFLQSVLIAGLLQASGVDAGVIMISRNDRGRPTNNGHAVTLVKLSDGTDVLIDASRPRPFARHQGLFGRVGNDGYRYVLPVFANAASPVILRYTAVDGGRGAATPGLRPAEIDFLRSQFAYYRGERAPGGALSARPTAAGLEAAARNLRTSVGACPRNPLPVYFLGRVYQKQRRTPEARTQFERARLLYERAGWVPAGMRQALVQTQPGVAAAARPGGPRRAAADGAGG